ncbi:50S ribosomal protein L10, partial [Clarias magur]
MATGVRDLTGMPLNSHPWDKLEIKLDLLLGRGPSIHTAGILGIPHTPLVTFRRDLADETLKNPDLL